MQQDVDQLELGLHSGVGSESAGVRSPERDELLGVPVGQEAHAPPGGAGAGGGAGRRVAAGVGVAGGVGGEAVVGVGLRRRDGCDSGVHRRPARRRQALIRGGAHEIVGEVDISVVVGAQHAVAFELAERGEQIDRVAVCERGKQTGRDRRVRTAAIHGTRVKARSWRRASRSPMRASTLLDSGSSPRASALAISTAKSGLPLVACAMRDESAPGAMGSVSSAIVTAGSGPIGNSLQRVVSAEPFDEPAAGGVVVELGRPRGGDERDVGGGRVEVTHREVEERHRGLVEPVDVVQEDGNR